MARGGGVGRRGDFIETAEALQDYNDPDTMILNRLEMLFSALLTVNVNGF